MRRQLSSRRDWLKTAGICGATGAISRLCRADEDEGQIQEKRREWYWDSLVNVHFDNGGRPLAKGMSSDTLVSQVQSIPVEMIQVAASTTHGSIWSAAGRTQELRHGMWTL